MKTRKKQMIAFCAIAMLFAGCSKKEEEAEADASATASPSAAAETVNTGYSAENFTLTVTDRSENGLKNPLNSISVSDPFGNTLDLTLSNTNQKTSYTCDDYSLNVSYSLMTDGVEAQTTVKYLIEVTDYTSSSKQSSVIQEEIFDYLPDTEWYEDGSAMASQTESPEEIPDDSDIERDSTIDIDESELGVSTTDDTVCVCDTCGKKFTTTSLWYAHVMEDHDGIASYHIESK